MENRGRKRAEEMEPFPADKRACAISEFRPGCSTSPTEPGSVNPAICSRSENLDFDMESSGSVSGREEEGESLGVEEIGKDYGYASCDSDGVDDSDHRGRSHHYHSTSTSRGFQGFLRRFESLSGDPSFCVHSKGKFKKILSSLGSESDPCSQLAALTELCDILSFCIEDSLINFSLDCFVPVLVNLAKIENNPDIMLLAIRALTHLCDVLPRSSTFLVRFDVVPVLCARLMAIEYLDVAEQCLQALEKISHDHPVACLQAGAIMAVLNYIDFFSTSIQRVALSTAANICKKLTGNCSTHVMEAVPILCNLLQYEDRKLVENVALCLIRIVECLSSSADMLDELCKHGVLRQAIHLISVDSRMMLSQPTYSGLIGLLSRLASGSIVAVRALFNLNITSTLRDILTSSDLARGMQHSLSGDAHLNQMHEVLKLLTALLPPLARGDANLELVSAKEENLKDQPELLLQYGIDILPVLIQVAGSGANMLICYGCLSVINKIVYFSTADMLLVMLKKTNISSFLARVLSWKDDHIMISALQAAEIVMQKLPDVFFKSFVKEGVVYAIDALLIPEKCSDSQFMLQRSISIQYPVGPDHQKVSKDAMRCVCYTFDMDQSPSSEVGTCKVEKKTVKTLAKHIKDAYFLKESGLSGIGLTEKVQKMRTFCTELTNNVSTPIDNHISGQDEEHLFHVLNGMLRELYGGDSLSTFEFTESGIVKSLIDFLSCGKSMEGKTHDLPNHFQVVLKRFQMFARFALKSPSDYWEDMPLVSLVQKLQSALSSLDHFPVIMSHVPKSRNVYANIPTGRCTMHPCLKVRFVKEEGENALCDYSSDILTVESLSSLDAIEEFLWPKVSRREHYVKSSAQCVNQSNSLTSTPPPSPAHIGTKYSNMLEKNIAEDEVNGARSKAKEKSLLVGDSAEVKYSQDNDRKGMRESYKISSGSSKTQGPLKQEPRFLSEMDNGVGKRESGTASTSKLASSSKEQKADSGQSTSSMNEFTFPKLNFYLEGQQLERGLTLYQSILQQQVNAGHDVIVGLKFWNEVYKVTYRRAAETEDVDSQGHLDDSQFSPKWDKSETSWQTLPFFSSTLTAELPCNLEKSNPAYDILLLLKILEGLNRFGYHLMAHERRNAFAEGRIDNFDDLKVTFSAVPQTEFISSKLTEKLEQQMRDPSTLCVGTMPSWCSHLMGACQFLFSFEAKRKYFHMAVFGPSRVLPYPWQQQSNDNMITPNIRRSQSGSLPRKKFHVYRSRVLDSATEMMDLYARSKAVLEVEYHEEVGTGLGPTMEFYTLVSHEFQKVGLGMWRESNSSSMCKFYSERNSQVEDSGFVVAPFGLFPCPWSAASSSSDGTQFPEVIKKFVLLGQFVAKALQDGRVLDLSFSKAFYKIILGQELDIYDIQSFDHELGRTLLEFQALVDRKKFLDSAVGDHGPLGSNLFYHGTRVEDLCLDFSLPGYPDYILKSGLNYQLLDVNNLEEYVSLVVDATVRSGISKQVEAFKSGFNQVFPVKSLQIFAEDELEHLLCGEQDTWVFDALLDHIKFDHGYTASSPPVVNLLEIIREFECDQRRAFLLFVTGAPRLPPGGLAALSPKLTIVRKHCSERADGDLPSVMTCANYLKLPPYSSKERMRERLLYAITEGQGSFHLS